ncbi:MAG: twin-arginine translocation signal domain-containing protein [Acidobacteriia bacterium]|nr:twin-arginine translocation signal domain-containing protein [Terriglobia bacterium]
MIRRDFLKASSAAALAAGLAARPLHAYVPGHNFDKYDFGSGPPVADRLYQGPFPTDLFPSWNVMMATTSSPDPVPNYGMGLVTYICDETGPPRHAGQNPEKLIEDLIRLPLGSALYLRVNWKDVQQKSGRLDLCVNVWDAGGRSMSGSNDPTTRRKVFARIAAHEALFMRGVSRCNRWVSISLPPAATTTRLSF